MSKFQDYPLLALRGRVVFPNTTVNFDVGRMISLSAVKYAADGDSRIFVCAQKQSDKEEITDDDIFTSGTVVKLYRPPESAAHSPRAPAPLCRPAWHRWLGERRTRVCAPSL